MGMTDKGSPQHAGHGKTMQAIAECRLRLHQTGQAMNRPETPRKAETVNAICEGAA